MLHPSHIYVKLWISETNWQLCLYLFICSVLDNIPLSRLSILHSNYSGQFLTFIQIVWILYTYFPIIFCYCLHSLLHMFCWWNKYILYMKHRECGYPFKKGSCTYKYVYLYCELGCIYFEVIKLKCEQKVTSTSFRLWFIIIFK